MTETTATSMTTARATLRATVMATATARAAIIRTTVRMIIATDPDDGNGGHYYECGLGGEMR